MFFVGGAEIAEKLGGMFIENGTDGLEFDDEFIFNEEVRGKLAKWRAVFVVNIKRVLLYYVDALFAQAMSERVLVDFFEMSVTMIFMNGKRCFSDDVAEFEYVRGSHDLCFLLVAGGRVGPQRGTKVTKKRVLIFVLFVPFCGYSFFSR